MNPNITSVFNCHLDEKQKDAVREIVFRKALHNLRNSKTLEHNGYSIFRMEFLKRKRNKENIKTSVLIDKVLEDVVKLYKDMKEHPSDITKQYFERVTNSPIEPVMNIPVGCRYILSLERFQKIRGRLPVTKTKFEENIEKLLKLVSDYTTANAKKMCTFKQANKVDYELIPIKHMILLSEPGCKEQLLHRDFSSDVLKHAVFANKQSLYILMYALTPRSIRCYDESHKECDAHKDCKICNCQYDAEDKSCNPIGLLKGTAVVMHPWLVHSGGSNNSSSISVCLLCYVVLKDKADKVHERFEVVDQKLTECIAQHGSVI